MAYLIVSLKRDFLKFGTACLAGLLCAGAATAATQPPRQYPSDPAECLLSLKKYEKDRLVKYAIDILKSQNLKDEPQEKLDQEIVLQAILCTTENGWPWAATDAAKVFMGANINIFAMESYLKDKGLTVDQIAAVYDAMDESSHALMAIENPTPEDSDNVTATMAAAFAANGVQLNDGNREFAYFTLLTIDAGVRSDAALREIIKNPPAPESKD